MEDQFCVSFLRLREPKDSGVGQLALDMHTRLVVLGQSVTSQVFGSCSQAFGLSLFPPGSVRNTLVQKCRTFMTDHVHIEPIDSLLFSSWCPDDNQARMLTAPTAAGHQYQLR